MKGKLLVLLVTIFFGVISTSVLYANRPEQLLDKLFLNSNSNSTLQCQQETMVRCTPGTEDFCNCMRQDEISGCLKNRIGWSYCCDRSKTNPDVINIVNQVCHSIGIRKSCIVYRIPGMSLAQCESTYKDYLTICENIKDPDSSCEK